MILISKTPLRISLFGGGTDFPEFFSKKKSIIIGGAIDKFIYIILTKYYSDLFKHKLKFFYSKLEFVKTNKDITHPVIKEVFTNKKINKNIEMHIASDLPSHSGLGSSSSFSVGLLNLINYYKKRKLKPIDLAFKAISLERDKLKECVGFQDQIFAAVGGFQKIEISKGKKIKIIKYKNKKLISAIQNNLFIVYSGIKRSAKNIEKKKLSKIKKNFNNLNKIKDIAILADKKFKTEKNPDFVGHLLSKTWDYKKKLDKDVTNSIIDNLYSKCKRYGALGGKLLGAGAGGFILIYVPKKNQKKFLNKMKSKVVNFNFYKSGSNIISV